MSSLLKAQTANAKGKGKRPANDEGEAGPPRKRNKQRVLLLSSRGITHRMRHLMGDLEALLPHIKKDSKLDSKNHLHLLPELADLHNCNNTLYFEARRHEDLYLWAAKTPNGPSVKMHVQNVHTMDELKMTGNCLKGSRGLLSFDPGFDSGEHWKLIKELFTHVSPTHLPVLNHPSHRWDRFSEFRPLLAENFQIIEKDPLKPNGPPETSLVEIGPRFVLTPIRIFEGAFGGATVFSNPEFVSPAAIRSQFKREQGEKYRARKEGEAERNTRREERRREEDELAVRNVFNEPQKPEIPSEPAYNFRLLSSKGLSEVYSRWCLYLENPGQEYRLSRNLLPKLSKHAPGAILNLFIKCCLSGRDDASKLLVICLQTGRLTRGLSHSLTIFVRPGLARRPEQLGTQTLGGPTLSIVRIFQSITQDPGSYIVRPWGHLI
ncbi:ribosome biogenesis protein BRX1 [Rhizoctonia solani AG-1 IA]|uniref:Ribosome biogenesis protein BRX1 n=1 Tax=Thanatephorus cucumeris (strain AG1-IA) TaxID=983506 RepID=L8X429_THACA|nr:ribosome biogenesis protein BRX1 [Rhizoctonia solani AG-1 IA]